MKTKTLLFTGLLLCQSLFGQVIDFQKDFNKINEQLMLGLRSYALANFALSGIGYVTSEDEYSMVFLGLISSTLEYKMEAPAMSP